MLEKKEITDKTFMYPTRPNTEMINQDRREDRRYPIELELQYKVLARSRTHLRGSGRTLNMSSGGVLFDVDQNVPAGAFVELSIRWPVLLQNTSPLTLLVVGRVVRSDAWTVAIKTSRYEFITQAAAGARDLESAKPANTYIA